MPKVAILKSGLANTGGLEKNTQRIANALSKDNPDVHILTSGKSDAQLKDSNLHIVHFGKLFSSSLLRLWQFDRLASDWVDKMKPDIVLGMDRNRCETHYRAGNGVHAAYLKRRALTDSYFKRLTFKINPLHLSILHFEKQTFESKRLRCLITNSDMVRREVLEYYNADEACIHVLHNGVEWHEMQKDFDEWKERRPSLYKELGLNPNSFQFLFVGNGYRRKGLEFLFKGLKLLKNVDYELSVVGSEREMETFKEYAMGFEIQNRVHFFGPRKDISKFYQVADALVIPSLYDPFANVTLEALAMGLFVVSSKFNGGKEVLTPMQGTCIEDLFDPESVREALQKALQRPKTPTLAFSIRESVKSFDYLDHLEKFVSMIYAS